MRINQCCSTDGITSLENVNYAKVDFHSQSFKTLRYNDYLAGPNCAFDLGKGSVGFVAYVIKRCRHGPAPAVDAGNWQRQPLVIRNSFSDETHTPLAQSPSKWSCSSIKRRARCSLKQHCRPARHARVHELCAERLLRGDWLEPR